MTQRQYHHVAHRLEGVARRRGVAAGPQELLEGRMVEELFLKLAGDLPKEMIFQRELLISRL